VLVPHLQATIGLYASQQRAEHDFTAMVRSPHNVILLVIAEGSLLAALTILRILHEPKMPIIVIEIHWFQTPVGFDLINVALI